MPAVRSVASGSKFYRLPPDKENTEVGVGIIFNEVVINKTVFRMVLLLFIDGKYFNLSSAIIFISAEREAKDSRRSGRYQSCHFLTRLGKQSL